MKKVIYEYHLGKTHIHYNNANTWLLRLYPLQQDKKILMFNGIYLIKEKDKRLEENGK